LQDEIRKKNYKARIAPHLRDLRLTSLWLTQNRPDADELFRYSLAKAYKLWRPSLPRAKCRILLFKVLTGVFYSGIKKRPAILSIGYEKISFTNNSHNRLALPQDVFGSFIDRTLVRLPVEIKYIEFLTGLEGLSSNDIGEIIGLSQDSITPGSNRGFRLLQNGPFIYRGEG
jgi:DNA-directed RNA polymerase specialized sigma24 family protein